MTTTTSSPALTRASSVRKFASLVPVVMTTFSAVLFQWNSETNVRVDSRPTPSAYPSFVFSSSFTSRAASSSVSGSTPDSERSYLTLCSQTDCMRSISKAGNFIDAPRYPHVSCGGSDIAARRDTRRTALWALHPNRAFVTERLVRDTHSAGMKVQAWTVNDPAEITRFAALGVDGLMSDFPERIPK